MALNYAKWDTLVDSDDECASTLQSSSHVLAALQPGRAAGNAPEPPTPEGARISACTSRDEPVSGDSAVPAASSTAELEMKVPCYHCGRILSYSELKKCSRCGVARYCSRSCQVASWPTHKPECVSSSDLKFQAPHVVKDLMSLLIKFCGVPIFEAPQSKPEDVDGVSSPARVVSLIDIGRHFRAKHGQCIVGMVFETVAECEDLMSGLSIACRGARQEGQRWIVSRLLPFPRLCLSRLPLGSDPSDEIGRVFLRTPGTESVLQVLQDNPGLVGLYGFVGASEGVPGSSAQMMVTLPLDVSVASRLLSDAPHKPPRSLRAVDKARALSRRIEVDSEFRKCRQLLFQWQQAVGVKGVFWLRPVNDPKMKGYLEEDLATVTPRALKAALIKELKKVLPSNNYALRTSAVIGFYPLSGGHLALVQQVWSNIDPEHATPCHGFFLTYPDERSDAFVLTQFAIRASTLT